MKRRLLLLTCLMVLSFTGCNDSDKNNQEMEDTKPIEKEDVDDSEAAQVTTDTEQTIEVSDYFQEPRQIIELLDMEKAEPWQFPEGDSYAKDGFKLELYDNLFSFKIVSTFSISSHNFSNCRYILVFQGLSAFFIFSTYRRTGFTLRISSLSIVVHFVVNHAIILLISLFVPTSEA